jgi:DNA-binding GntR family transcriptional regulator
VFGGAGRTFLVETYVPGLDERAAVSLSSRLREAIRQLAEEGVILRWDGSFALVDEETFICIIGAASVDDVVELSKRAGFEPDHVVEVFAIDAPATQGR